MDRLDTRRTQRRNAQRRHHTRYEQAFAQFLSETTQQASESCLMYPGGHNRAPIGIAYDTGAIAYDSGPYCAGIACRPGAGTCRSARKVRKPAPNAHRTASQPDDTTKTHIEFKHLRSPMRHRLRQLLSPPRGPFLRPIACSYFSCNEHAGGEGWNTTC